MIEKTCLLIACACAGLLVYTAEANYQYQQGNAAQRRAERVIQNRRELAKGLSEF